MKVLYGVTGEGMGHAMRSRVVLEHLVAEQHDVTIMASGRAVDFLSKRFADVNRIHGLHMIYEENRVRIDKTLWSNVLSGAAGIPRNIAAYFELIGEFRPEVVISDFESWTYLYGKMHRLPVLSIDNMQIINRTRLHDELIEGQYADRPQLRPILDAVLALLPALGPATVQARRTIVSLVCPRRTFAVVRATTKDRVDLGLRLDDAEPGGRLQSAKGIGGGGATVRIALRRPEDIDEEVRGLMRRAYEENTAPPPPRRPARRPGAVAGTMTVVIEGSELPGRTCRPEPDGQDHQDIYVALGGRSEDRPALTMSNKPGMAIEPVPGDAPAARWEMPVTVRRDEDGFDFGGPFVRGVRDDRHLGLIWGDLIDDETLQVFRGAKLRLVDVDPDLIEQALRPGHTLVARIRLTDARGNPICARVHPPYLTWSAAADGAG